MAFKWLSVGAFGGGLDYTKHPSALRDDQWSQSAGWIARDGYAETANDLVLFAELANANIPPNGSNPQIIGLVQNPFGQDGALMGVVGDPASFNASLYTVNGQGVITFIPSTSGPRTLSGSKSAVLQGAFIGGNAVLSFGVPTLFNTGSIAIWPGTGPYDEIPASPSGVPGFHFLVPFQGHLVFALGNRSGAVAYNETDARTIYWGPSNEARADVPDISNDADEVILDDASSGVSLLAKIGSNVCGIFTRNAIYGLAPTGSIPAFTRQLLYEGLGAVQLRTSAIGSAWRGQSFWGATPIGAMFCSLHDLNLMGGGGPQGVGTPIFRYWSSSIEPTADPTIDYHQTFTWDERAGLVLVPRPRNDATPEWFYFDPTANVWSRVLPTADPDGQKFLRSQFIYSFDANGVIQREIWATTQNRIYREAVNTPIPLASVDTKDFAFGSPPFFAYVDRIKVDWECRTDPINDQLQVFASVRNHLLDGVTDPTIVVNPQEHFIFLGNLKGGQSELSCRLKAKYMRFRFRQISGHVRVRGFHLRYQPASDKKVTT